ncbi:diguanylate cyclase (GGDEF) domain-containing protein [Modicisalibacter ilicicola DSM 19980]|uniref:diguanylate cyclase n=1 Tax=Modicisalibacter ilicicola DSM 19980 TaxID=1121942 RepID=A0A1M4ZBJ7_9GAMM|nr:diguanylate cyclase [Halomonas ilicicola]SHF14966.1 diguanylate cyclase (GGDEF) domain-containing protein [Halomonas ilicicola DSM 19980]
MSRVLASLRYRFLLALSVVLLLALAALGFIAQQLILPALLAEEDEYAAAEIDRALLAIDNELDHLYLLNRDWGVWDDTHAFMQEEAPQYQASNLAQGAVFDEANLRLMIFLDADAAPHLIAGIDPANGAYTACPAPTGECAWTVPMVASLQKRIHDGVEPGRAAWLQASPELGLMSVSPILESDGSGPSLGWLSMIREMDAAWLSKLKRNTGLNLSLTAPRDGPVPLGASIRRDDSRTMTAVREIQASPAGSRIRLQITLPRQGFKSSLDTLLFALYWTIGLLVVVVIVVLILLERMILAPLRHFAAFAQDIDTLARNDMPPGLRARHDEIGKLARKFQHLLEHQRQRTSSLVELSQHDPLTGLANRRLFDERIDHALEAARSDRRHVALLMIDIDHFKAYNDHYGHPAGDACLKVVAETMRKHFNQSGQLVARTGGEEFTIILPGTTPAESTARADELRMAIESLALPHAGSPHASLLTVSIGVATASPQERCSAAQLIQAADDALYEAKQAGRNCTRLMARQVTATA